MNDALRSPVFILGTPRSGTTLLYEMLAATGHFNVVTARHVICFDELRGAAVDRERSRQRLRSRFERLGLSDRGVDVFGLRPDSPEEYCFILDNLRCGQAITRRNFRVFQTICGLIHRDSEKCRRMLLKNPWDFGNARTIKSLMPDAKIVYIHRNPFHVLGSLYRLMMVAIGQPSEYLALLNDRYDRFIRNDFEMRLARSLVDRWPGLLAQGVIFHIRRLTSAYLKDHTSVPRHDRIDIRYETLCQEPVETMAAIHAHLELDGSPPDYAAMIGTHASRVAPEIVDKLDLVIEKLSDYAAAVGYDLPTLAQELE